MFRGFFFFLQLKRTKEKEGRGGGAFALRTLWCWSHGFAWGMVWKCAWLCFFFLFFFVFCSEINFRQAPFSIVKATPHLLHCKDNFTFWPNDYELWVSIYVCVHVCVAFHFSWTFHSRLPQALSAETWLLLLSFFFFFFWVEVRPCPCWISVTELVSYCVWSMVCRARGAQWTWKPSTGLNAVS